MPKKQKMIKCNRCGRTIPAEDFREHTLGHIGKNLERIRLFSLLQTDKNHVNVFQGDARNTSLILSQNGIGHVDFIITSPPYINAQDYFRSYKLELRWIGLSTTEEALCLKKKAIGTETCLGKTPNVLAMSKSTLLNKVLREIWKRPNKMSRTKAHMASKYFSDMETVLSECYQVLKPEGHFCLITGNNTICEVEIPTYKILAQIALTRGFTLVEMNRDEIKNRALPPDRKHNGGVIKEEWITVFEKNPSQ